MRTVSIIIPVWNEEANINPLVQRIHSVLSEAKITYEIIFIDDNSSDKTVKRIKTLIKQFPISVFTKVGNRGKAQSLIEGFSHAKYAYFAMMDGDLQYPPEALPGMLGKLDDTADIVVANRVIQHTSRIRKIVSKGFKTFFGKALFGLNYDIQAGLKVFKKEVYEHLKYRPSSGWTFDLEFLHKAKQGGFSIEGYDIVFDKRTNGGSKVSFIRASLEIGLNAVSLKAKGPQPIHFRSLNAHSMKDAGVGYKQRKYITHTTLHHTQSAIQTFTLKQKYLITLLLPALLVGLIVKPLLSLQIFVGLLSFIYFIDVVFNFFLVMKSLHFPQEITSTDEELALLNTEKLPVYSILCPLYKEAHVIPQFVEAIGKLDWPKEKLDVLLLLEEDDKVSIETVKNLNLPKYIRSVVVPHSMPKTKPKACNYGLSEAKGEYLVIYDAEDMPDPLQLKKAYLGFGKAGENVVCLQAKLNYYNPNQNLLTRFFTAEYSLWFDVTLTGLQAAGTSIPLGGTSNHFRTKDLHTLEGWDPFNVTEDADLGIRLFKKGYRTAIIDSVTLEEANSDVFNWIRQRSRWIKGYMQTYLVHTRESFGLSRKNFLHSLFFHLNIGGKIAFILINPFLWVATISYFVLYKYVGPTIESLYPSYIFYMALISLVFGNFMFLYYYMIGAAKRDQWALIKYVYFIPFYWLLISWSGFIAFYQLLFKPHYWEKTIHGLHLKKAEKNIIAEIVVQTEEKDAGLRFPTRFRNSLIELITKKTYLSGVAYVAAIGLGSFLNLIFSAYLGRVLPLEDFGLVSLISGLLSFITIIASSVGTTINYRTGFLIGKHGESSAFIFWSSIRKNAFRFTIVTTIIWLLISPYLMHFFNTNSIYPFIIFSPIILIGLIASIDRGLIGSRLMFISLAIINILEPAIKLLLAFIFVHVGLQSWAYSSMSFSTVTIFFVGWLFVTRNRKKENLQIQLETSTFPWQFLSASLLSGISIVVFLTFDVILVKHFLSPTDAGRYALISLVGKMIFFLGALISPFITPFVSRSEGSNADSKRLLKLSLLGTFVLTFIGFLAVGVFAHFTVPILFGQKTLSIIEYLPLVCFAMMCLTISKVFVDYYLVKKYYGFSVAAFALGCIQLLLLSLFHDSIATVVIAINSVWITCLFVMIFLHWQKNTLKVLENNIADFLGLFAQFRKRKSEAYPQGNLRILILNWRDTRHKWAGGAEVYLHELAKRWAKDGSYVTIFCGNDGKHARNEIIDGVHIVRRGGFYTVYLWAFLYYIFKFRKLFDVIVDSENGIPFFTPLYANKKIFLLIHHVHQEVFRKSLIPPFSWLAVFLEAKAMPLVYKNVQVITVSPSSKEEIIKHKLTKNEPVVIYNGVDLTSFKPGKKHKKPLVLYVGRLQYYKSLNVFIKAAKKVLEISPSVEFIIAGEGEQKKKLQAYASKLELSEKIKFVGRISHEEKIKLFQKAWIFVNPSFMEGWGITTIEANACGTPAVASNVPGLRDSIQNPHTGFLAKYGDSEEFAEKILILIKNSQLRQEFSDESVRWAKNYDWNESAKSFYSLMEKEILFQLPATNTTNLVFASGGNQ